MKHITLIAMLFLAGATTRAQVVFESDLESWTDGLPDDFMGVRTSLEADSVFQVTDNPHGGTSAAQLVNMATASSDHRRFTTQPLSVTAGQAFDVTLWVRGNGDLRFGMYDERPGNGYSPYSSYVTVSSGETWEQVTFNIIAAATSDVAEFIFSVKSTTPPHHLIIDDVNISIGTVDPPVEATIAEIQNSTAPDGASPLAGTNVITQGVVSGVTGSSGYFLQDGSGEWSGIYVFNAPGELTIGDALSVTGTVTEFNGQTQLTGVLAQTVLSSGNALTATMIPTGSANTEAYESVLVQVVNAACTASGAFGQFTVNDGSGDALVDDVIYAFPFVVGTSYDITGVLQYAFSEWRILPRFEADVTIATGIGELAGATVTVFPNPANNMLTLDLGGVDGRTEYSLHDATGRLVMADVVTADRSAIDVSALTNGVYVMALRNNSATWSTRITVQH